MIGGNDDDPEVLELLRDANTQSIVFCEGKEVEIDDHHTMISVGFSNRTPWKTPREVDDDDLGKMIAGLAEGKFNGVFSGRTSWPWPWQAVRSSW